MSIVPGQPSRVLGVAMSRSMAAPAVMILNVDPGGYRPVVATGPSLSAAAFCATARISPVDGLITTIIAFLPVAVDGVLRGVLHGAVQADGDRRRRGAAAPR